MVEAHQVVEEGAVGEGVGGLGVEEELQALQMLVLHHNMDLFPSNNIYSQCQIHSGKVGEGEIGMAMRSSTCRDCLEEWGKMVIGHIVKFVSTA